MLRGCARCVDSDNNLVRATLWAQRRVTARGPIGRDGLFAAQLRPRDDLSHHDEERPPRARCADAAAPPRARPPQRALRARARVARCGARCAQARRFRLNFVPDPQSPTYSCSSGVSVALIASLSIPGVARGARGAYGAGAPCHTCVVDRIAMVGLRWHGAIQSVAPAPAADATYTNKPHTLPRTPQSPTQPMPPLTPALGGMALVKSSSSTTSSCSPLACRTARPAKISDRQSSRAIRAASHSNPDPHTRPCLTSPINNPRRARAPTSAQLYAATLPVARLSSWHKTTGSA